MPKEDAHTSVPGDGPRPQAQGHRHLTLAEALKKEVGEVIIGLRAYFHMAFEPQESDETALRPWRKQSIIIKPAPDSSRDEHVIVNIWEHPEDFRDYDWKNKLIEITATRSDDKRWHGVVLGEYQGVKNIKVTKMGRISLVSTNDDTTATAPPPPALPPAQTQQKLSVAEVQMLLHHLFTHNYESLDKFNLPPDVRGDLACRLTMAVIIPFVDGKIAWDELPIS